MTSHLMRPYSDSLNFRRIIGFDELFEELTNFSKQTKDVQNYPPYNVIRINETTHRIELAVAGFKREHLTITQENNKLIVEGKFEETNQTDKSYVHRGLSKRKFTSEFILGEHMNVTNVTLEDGIIKIDLETKIPDNLKPKTFEIK